jgi:lantibiotic modifying enzyme
MWVRLCCICLIIFWYRPSIAQNDYLELSKQIGQYLINISSDNGEKTTWPVKPEISEEDDISLYSGIPGILLFMLEMHNATGDSIYLDLAVKGGLTLTDTIPDSIISTNQLGLYTGAGGIAFTLKELYKSTNDKRFKSGYYAWLRKIEEHLLNDKNNDLFGGITDIIYGAAGIGLVFLDTFKSDNEDWIKDNVILCAEYLISKAVPQPTGLTWKMSPQMPYYMDNFSHGTAGISFFLLEAFTLTGNIRYKEVGSAGAEYVYAQGKESGLICHHHPGGEDLFYLGWCHGPPGTAKVYMKMYQLTKQNKWLSRIKENADYMISLELNKNNTPGYWNNEGWCCGTVGIAQFFRTAHSLLGDKTYAEYADRLEMKLLKASLSDKNQLRWKHAENRKSPEEEFIQTGLMQGSAGFGLYFMRQYYRSKKMSPIVKLPDELKL